MITSAKQHPSLAGISGMVEAPVRRRMTMPLRQSIDLKFVRVSEAPVFDVATNVYDRRGRTMPVARHGRFLSESA